MIKLKDFVDVNLTSVVTPSDEENKTVVYIYGATSGNRVVETLNASNYTTKKTSFDATAQAFIDQFFTLGGASLKVIKIITQTAEATSTILSNNTAFINEIKALKMSEVAIVLRKAQEGNISQTESDLYDATGYHYETVDSTDGFATLLASIKAVVTEKGTAFRKLIVRYYAPSNSSTYTEAELVGDSTLGTTGLVRDINLIWKLCNDEKDLASVLAYLSKVTISNPDTLKDYSFTEELTCTDMFNAFVDVDWNTIKSFVNTSVNLQQESTGVITNLGGNTSAGYDLIQEFESIYISQKLVDKELSLLRSKLSLTDAKSVIHSAIIDIMEIYYNIGYLVQTKYTGSNIYRNVGGQNVCVLAKGEVISGGYKVIILPKVAGEDIHNFPEIEVIINTNKGIRYIKTTGVVL